MAEIDVLKAQIVRENSQSPWGFRLKGGAELGQSLSVARVTPGSAAARIGVQCGDVITEIEDTPTQGLTTEQANDIVKQYGLSIVLTIERRAAGVVPMNPVIQQHSASPPLKAYQTYDLTGAHRQNDHGVAVSRPYSGAPPGVRVRTVPPPHHQEDPHAQASPQQASPQYSQQTVQNNYHPQHQVVSPPPTFTPGQHVYRQPEEEKYMDGTAQSRTFRILQSVMHSEGGPCLDTCMFGDPVVHPSMQADPVEQPSMQNDPHAVHDNCEFLLDLPPSFYQSKGLETQVSEPAAGSYGLPRQRSAYMEQQHAAKAAKQFNGPRMKVFVPQQYNSPIGMYSAHNLIDTFQNQAEIQMQELERQEAQ